MEPMKTAQAARRASAYVAAADRKTKDAALLKMAELLETHKEEIVAANEADIEDARKKGLQGTMIDRLKFGPAKVDSRVESLKTIASLPDPVGRTLRDETTANGLRARRVAVPLGVILMIYEARPHVSVNAGAFCLKAGNAAILRGGSEAKRCNGLLGTLWTTAVEHAGLPSESVQMVGGSHEDVDALLQMPENIDLVIPRGGKGLIDSVSRKSRIPVIKHYAGVCNVYIDGAADLTKAIDIALDSKCLMPEVCNAAETVLVSEQIVDKLPKIISAFRECGILVKGCEKTRGIVSNVEPATEEDWSTEYLDLTYSVRVVADVQQAIEHINTYGSHHTDTIVTESSEAAGEFTKKVDSGVVLVNASTMFCDGATLGMGAEIGISTDKLHARGPMGLEELTTYKFVIGGDGHIMGNREEYRRK